MKTHRAQLVCLIAAVLAGFWPLRGAADSPPPSAAAALAGRAEFRGADFAAALLAETNRVRRSQGRPALTPSSDLDAAADDQAAINSLRLVASHDSPVKGQATPQDRLSNHGVNAVLCAENVASIPVGDGEVPLPAGQIAAALVDAWMNSPGHRANLLNRSMTHLGCAIRVTRGPNHTWYAFGVQDFARLRPPPSDWPF